VVTGPNDARLIVYAGRAAVTATAAAFDATTGEGSQSLTPGGIMGCTIVGIEAAFSRTDPYGRLSGMESAQAAASGCATIRMNWL
jgi:hypothetical protein